MPWRFWLAVVLACMAANTLLDLLGVPVTWWRVIVVDLVVMFGLAAWVDRHRIRARWLFWREARKPMVLDEDGTVHVPVLGPGETIEMIYRGDGKAMAAQVLRPDGSVRLRSDWSTRH